MKMYFVFCFFRFEARETFQKRTTEKGKKLNNRKKSTYTKLSKSRKNFKKRKYWLNGVHFCCKLFEYVGKKTFLSSRWVGKERERERKYESHSFYGTQLGPPNAKRNETHETVPFTTASQRPTKRKTCERKKKTSIVDVIKKNELGGMRGETNTDSKRWSLDTDTRREIGQ